MAALAGWQERFAKGLSEATGLARNVVRGWVLAESGPPSNPLNIGPGKDFGTVDQAVTATAAFIKNNSNYYPLTAAAKTGNTWDQLAAITASPWDACNYRGTLPNGACVAGTPGAALVGAFVTANGITA